MKLGKWRLLLLGVLVAAPLLIFTLRGSAQTPDSLNLTASPLPIALSGKPGETITTDLRIRNTGTSTEILKVDLLKFAASGDSGTPQLLSREPGDDYFDWVKFSETQFKAEPNVQKTIKMTISLPSTAAFGYYYAVVFSRANPTPGEDGQATLDGGLASLVLVDAKSPNTRRQVEIEEFKAEKRVYEFLPANFSVKFKNTGNIHVAPHGTIYIKKGSKQIETIEFNGGRGNVLPGSSRVITADWKNGFPVYELTQDSKTKLKWDFTKLPSLRIGRYKATILAIYDDGEKDVPLEATVTFWVIPWRILGGILLFVLLVGVALWSIGRKAWRRARRKPADTIAK